MKKGLMMALAAVGMMIGTGAFAQKQMPKAEEMAWKQADKLKSELMLNDTQTKQVYEQLLWNMEQKKENAKETWAKTDAAMKKVLTPEQYQKWSSMQKERMEKAKDKGHDMMKDGKSKGHEMMKDGKEKADKKW